MHCLQQTSIQGENFVIGMYRTVGITSIEIGARIVSGINHQSAIFGIYRWSLKRAWPDWIKDKSVPVAGTT